MAKPKGKTKVRTTFNPAVVLEVDSAELTDLERQGLIHSREGGKGWQGGKAEVATSGVVTDAPSKEGDTK